MRKYLLFCILIITISFTSLQAKTKIMPLGDSITWDWHYSDERTDAERSGYRNYLWYFLKNAELDVDFVGHKTNGGAVVPLYDGDNEGYTGWTSYQISDTIYHLLEMNPPDIILLHIGTNDSLYYPSTSTSGVERILNEVDRFERDEGIHIKVILARIISLPSQAAWVSQFNNSIQTMAQNRIRNGDDITIVDMEYGAGLNYDTDLIDGIHPNDCGYEKMASVWFSTLTGEDPPELKYSNCTDNNEEDKEDEENLDELYAYPETLVEKEYIISLEVEEKSKSVTFIVEVPESGIRF